MPRGLLCIGKGQRHPCLDSITRTRVDEDKIAWHDADDLMRPTIDPQIAADRRWIAIEQTLPACVTEHHLALVTDFPFRFVECSSEYWCHRGDPEQGGRRDHRLQPLWLVIKVNGDR